MTQEVFFCATRSGLLSHLHGLQQGKVLCCQICWTIQACSPGNDQAMAARFGVCIIDDYAVIVHLHFWVLILIPAYQRHSQRRNSEEGDGNDL